MSDKFNDVKYNNAYNKENYERITVMSKRENMLKSRLETLSISTGKSKNQLILEAVETMLQREGL